MAAQGTATPPGSTPEEERNLEVVKEYMERAYDPGRAAAVRHLVAERSKFISPTTFPEVAG